MEGSGALPVLVSALLVLLALAAVRRGAFLRVHWRPDRGAVAAIATGLLAAAFSATLLWLPRGSATAHALHFLGIYGVCGALLPWWWVTRVERSGAAAMGLSRERLGVSIAISVGAGAILFARVLTAADLSRADPVYLLRGSYSLLAGGLFELFLYYGFVHLRLLRAFGPIPAVVGSAAIYALWHLGTELPMHDDPGSGLVLLFAVGLLYHAVFQITRNLASIWPFFFLGGVWVDFGVNLGFPPEIARDPAWVTVSWLILVGAPVVLLRMRPGREG